MVSLLDLAHGREKLNIADELPGCGNGAAVLGLCRRPPLAPDWNEDYRYEY
jgi:hypothetical protein